MQSRSIFKRIHRSIKINDKAFLIGINGYDGSGKTYFSKHFRDWLIEHSIKVQIIHLDDFHNPLKKRREGITENQAYIDNAFNLEQIRTELLDPLSKGVFVNKQLILLDLQTDEYTLQRNYHIDTETVVLFEGVLLYRSPINQYFDLRLFLEVPEDILLKRNIQRASEQDPEYVQSRYEKKYLPIQRWYRKRHRPHEISDFVIDNTDYESPEIMDLRSSKK